MARANKTVRPTFIHFRQSRISFRRVLQIAMTFDVSIQIE
jgi:hypothetical protein